MDNHYLEAPVQRTLSDYIADQLREAILAEELKPGQRLVEQEIAESMQTSRGPVRDALRLLENEGLVVRSPHRGAFVAELTEEDAWEIYTLREALEALAVEYVIDHATPEQIDELEKLAQAMESQSHKGSDPVKATELDIRFHHTLCKISGHSRVLSTWDALSAQVRLLLLKYRMTNPSTLRERGEDDWHRQIIEPIRQRNKKAALAELRFHLSSSAEGLIKSMQEKTKKALE